MDSAPAGNFAGRQRKSKDEQTNRLFPPVSGVAFGQSKKEGGGGGRGRGSPRRAPSSISSGSTWSERGSSCLSSISDSHTYSSSFRFSSSISFLREPSPCIPICSSAPIYSRRSRREAGTKLSIPESIAEEEEEQKETGEGAGGEGRAGGSGKIKKKKRKSKKRRKNTVPIPRTRNGRHYLEWNIPKELIESLCLKESLPTIVMPPPPLKELSPMHSVEKYHWVKKLTDPEAKALPFPSYGPEKPKAEEHPSTNQQFLESFKKCFEKSPNVVIYGKKVTPSDHKTSKPPPGHTSKTFPFPFSANHEHKSLLLNHNDYFTVRQRGNAQQGMAGPMFTKCPGEGMWFVVHPDFRMEPGMRGVGPESKVSVDL